MTTKTGWKLLGDNLAIIRVPSWNFYFDCSRDFREYYGRWFCFQIGPWMVLVG